MLPTIAWLGVQSSVAQAIAAPATSAALIFSGPQFWISLIAGVLMSFGFQLLLTNLSIASVLSPRGGNAASETVESDSTRQTIRNLENGAGIWIISTVSTALFLACFLAVKLSLITSVFLGAVVGVVIWSTYFTLMLWFSSSTVGSLIGTLVKTASSGLQGILGTATAAVGASVTKNQAISTAEEITAAIRRELTAGIDSDSIRETLQSTVSAIQLPSLNLDEIGTQFEKILRNSDLKELANPDLLQNVNRDTFVNLIGDRADLSKEDINRLVDRLDRAWQQVAPVSAERNSEGNTTANQSSSSLQNDLVGLLGAATAGQILSNPNQLIQELQRLIDTSSSSTQKGSSLTNRALAFGLESLKATIRGNANLSNVDVEKLTGQLQKLIGKVSGDDRSTENRQPIKADIEHYILDSFPWHLNRLTIPTEFRDVIYDPNANPALVRQQLADLDQAFFVNLMTKRGDLAAAKIEENAEIMESIRQQVLEELKAKQQTNQAEELRVRLADFLKSANKTDFNEEDLQRQVNSLLEDPEAGIEELQQRFGQIDRGALMQVLTEREDISNEEANQILDRIETVRDRIVQTPRQVADKAKEQVEQTTTAIAEYLRNTNLEELNPEGIRSDLEKLFADPKTGAQALGSRLAQVDRDTLVKLLSQRGDLSEAQINQTLDQVQEAIDRIVKAPQRYVKRVQRQAADFEANLESYLRNTDKEALNPEGIKRDLELLLNDPRAGVGNLSDRLSKIDRDTIVALLAQRQDITEEEANQIVDQVLSVRDRAVEQVAQLQQRLQSTLDNVFDQIRTYLNSLNRPELNYEGIQQDFSKLFDDPKAGFEALRDRLSEFDRDTLVAVLSSREDISEADANRIVDRIEAARDSVLQRAEYIQRETQRRLDQIKHQAKETAIETQKTVANAAWWLFGAGLTSLIASASAGALAVASISWFGV